MSGSAVDALASIVFNFLEALRKELTEEQYYELLEEVSCRAESRLGALVSEEEEKKEQCKT